MKLKRDEQSYQTIPLRKPGKSGHWKDEGGRMKRSDQALRILSA
jgi:hypothetical protein